MGHPGTDSRVARFFAGPLALILSCAPAGSTGPSVEAGAAPEVTALPDPLTVYKSLDFITGTHSFPAVGRFVYLPGPGDTTYAVLSLSFPASALRFRREPPGLIAKYRITATIRDSVTTYHYLNQTEDVRVLTYRETSRSDESVFFQGFFKLRPGDYEATLEVQDMASRAGFLADAQLSVPDFSREFVTAPLIAYRLQPRADPAEPPSLILSPRATIDMGGSPRIYVESRPGSAETLVIELLTDAQLTWADTLPLDSIPTPLYTNVANVPADILAPGSALTLRARLGAQVSESTSLLVALGHEWIFVDHQEMMSYLRYSGTPAQLDSLQNAPPRERARRLHAFWQMRDPDPATPENEFFEAYFGRIQDANDRFSQPGSPGWLTDLGAVYVTLGPPDEVFRHLELEPGPGSSQVWLYNRSLGFDVRLVFVDESGVGGFGLTRDSRREFFQAVERIYSSSGALGADPAESAERLAR